MNHTMRQRSKLVQVAERGLDRKPNRVTKLFLGICIVWAVVILILNLLGVA